MDAAAKMDKQYRYQRYVYDVSRKYYLFGRDTLLNEMDVQPGESVLEIGCGTARNLLKLAYRYPGVNLYGADASSAMLEIAGNKLQGTLYENKIILQQGLADQLSHRDFGLEKPFDHIVFSYVLSMIPGWQSALHHALQLLRPGGYLHVVDFSDQASMPHWFRGVLLQWLEWFHVHPDPEILNHLEQMATQHHDQLHMRHLAGRYALLAHYQKRGTPNDDEPELPQISQYLDF